MSTSSTGSVERDSGHCWPCWAGRRGQRDVKSNWGGMNIAVMVVSFIVFWPAGLAVLAWILSGRHVRDLPAAIAQIWQRFTGSGEFRLRSGTDNVVFNEYQQTQYDRIAEIRNEIRERAHRFAAFRESAQRRRDREEFERFMADSPSPEQGQGRADAERGQ